MQKKLRLYSVISLIIILLLLLQACSLVSPKESEQAPVSESPQTEAPAMTEAPEPQVEETASDAQETEAVNPATEEPVATQIVHTFIPAEPGNALKTIVDTDSSSSAANKTTSAGDDYYSNKYERPFSQNEMVYYPDLDIQEASISEDDNFYYISISLQGLNPSSNNLTGTYAVELDTDLDGRGDFLFYCDLPNFTEWKIDTVHVFEDRNEDVGGNRPTYPETGLTGDGYETLVFSPSLLDDPDGFWCRQQPGSDAGVDLAIHKTLVGSPTKFAWGVWADLGLKQPGWFEYNDHFTLDQAGSPLAGNSYYPLKEIFALDNTCREAFGFTQTNESPGMCYQAPAPVVKNGSVSGVAYYDGNNNGVKDPIDTLLATATFKLLSGNCGASTTVISQTTSTSYSFSVAPGVYCLTISPSGNMTTPSKFSVTIESGVNKVIHFGYVIN